MVKSKRGSDDDDFLKRNATTKPTDNDTESDTPRVPVHYNILLSNSDANIVHRAKRHQYRFCKYYEEQVEDGEHNDSDLELQQLEVTYNPSASDSESTASFSTPSGFSLASVRRMELKRREEAYARGEKAREGQLRAAAEKERNTTGVNEEDESSNGTGNVTTKKKKRSLKRNKRSSSNKKKNMKTTTSTTPSEEDDDEVIDHDIMSEESHASFSATAVFNDGISKRQQKLRLRNSDAESVSEDEESEDATIFDDKSPTSSSSSSSKTSFQQSRAFSTAVVVPAAVSNTTSFNVSSNIPTNFLRPSTPVHLTLSIMHAKPESLIPNLPENTLIFFRLPNYRTSLNGTRDSASVYQWNQYLQNFFYLLQTTSRQEQEHGKSSILGVYVLTELKNLSNVTKQKWQVIGSWVEGQGSSGGNTSSSSVNNSNSSSSSSSHPGKRLTLYRLRNCGIPQQQTQRMDIYDDVRRREKEKEQKLDDDRWSDMLYMVNKEEEEEDLEWE